MTPETFCEQFATFAEAPNGVAKLRELILQLAVQGKLGTQDVNDEPAVVTHSEGNRIPDTGDRVLPNDWAIASLGDVARLRRGFDLPVGNRKTGDVPIFAANGIVGYHDEVGVTGPGVVTGRSGTIGKVHFVPGNYWPLNTALYVENFNGNDPQFIVLLLRSADLKRFSSQTAVPTLNRNVAHKAIVLVPPLAEQRRIVGKVDQLLGLCDELSARQAARREARERLVGATLDRLVSASWDRLPACLPAEDQSPVIRHNTRQQPPSTPVHTDKRTLSESAERRQAGSLSHAHRLRDHFDRLFDTPTTLPQLRQAILQLAVQGQLVPQDPNDEPIDAVLAKMWEHKRRLIDSRTIREPALQQPVSNDDAPFKLPTGWCWQRWGNVCDWITYGFTRPMSHVDSGPPIVTAKNVRDGFISLTETHYADAAEFAALSPKDRPRKGDLLIVKDGATIGRAAIVEDDQPFCISQTVAVLWLESCRLYRPFLLLMIQAASTQKAIWEAAEGAAMPHLSITDFAKMILPVPPLSEQKRIVSKVTELLSLCDALEAKLTQAESASTQLLSAAVHHLLTNETSPTAHREGEAPAEP
jgi:type I restriction enzyme S subunit